VKLLKFIGKVILWLLAIVIGVIALAVLVIAVRYWLWTPDPIADFYRDAPILNIGHRGAPGGGSREHDLFIPGC